MIIIAFMEGERNDGNLRVCVSVSSIRLSDAHPQTVGLGEVAFADSGVPVSYIDSSMTETLQELMQFSDSPVVLSLLPESQTETTTHLCMEMEDLRLAIRLTTGKRHATSLIQAISRNRCVLSGSRSIGERIHKTFGVQLENLACSDSMEQSPSTDVESLVQQWLLKTNTLPFFALSTLRQLGARHPCLSLPDVENAGVALKDALPKMDLAAKIGVWFDIVFATDYLHSHGVSCGCLNTHTVFVDHDFHAKVRCNNVKPTECMGDFVSDLEQLTLLHSAVLFYGLSESDSRFADSLLPCTTRKIRFQNDNAECCLSQDFVMAAIAACASRPALIDRFGSRIEDCVQLREEVKSPKNVQVCEQKLNDIVEQCQEISAFGWRLFMSIAGTQPVTAIEFAEKTEDKSVYPDNYNLRPSMMTVLEGIVVDAIVKKQKTIRAEDHLVIKEFLEKRDTRSSWYAFGKLSKRENNDDAMLMAFRRSASREYWLAFIELGKFYRKKKQPQKALQCFRRVLAVKGETMNYHGVSLYEIAKTHIDQQGDAHETEILESLQQSLSLGCFKGTQILCKTILQDSEIPDETVNDMITYLTPIADAGYAASYPDLIQFLEKRDTPSDRERAQYLSQLCKKIETFRKKAQGS